MFPDEYIAWLLYLDDAETVELEPTPEPVRLEKTTEIPTQQIMESFPRAISHPELVGLLGLVVSTLLLMRTLRHCAKVAKYLRTTVLQLTETKCRQGTQGYKHGYRVVSERTLDADDDTIKSVEDIMANTVSEIPLMPNTGSTVPNMVNEGSWDPNIANTGWEIPIEIDGGSEFPLTTNTITESPMSDEYVTVPEWDTQNNQIDPDMSDAADTTVQISFQEDLPDSSIGTDSRQGARISTAPHPAPDLTPEMNEESKPEPSENQDIVILKRSIFSKTSSRRNKDCDTMNSTRDETVVTLSTSDNIYKSDTQSSKCVKSFTLSPTTVEKPTKSQNIRFSSPLAHDIEEPEYKQAENKTQHLKSHATSGRKLLRGRVECKKCPMEGKCIIHRRQTEPLKYDMKCKFQGKILPRKSGPRKDIYKVERQQRKTSLRQHKIKKSNVQYDANKQLCTRIDNYEQAIWSWKSHQQGWNTRPRRIKIPGEHFFKTSDRQLYEDSEPSLLSSLKNAKKPRRVSRSAFPREEPSIQSPHRPQREKYLKASSKELCNSFSNNKLYSSLVHPSRGRDANLFDTGNGIAPQMARNLQRRITCLPKGNRSPTSKKEQYSHWRGSPKPFKSAFMASKHESGCLKSWTRNPWREIATRVPSPCIVHPPRAGSPDFRGKDLLSKKGREAHSTYSDIGSNSGGRYGGRKNDCENDCGEFTSRSYKLSAGGRKSLQVFLEEKESKSKKNEKDQTKRKKPRKKQNSMFRDGCHSPTKHADNMSKSRHRIRSCSPLGCTIGGPKTCPIIKHHSRSCFGRCSPPKSVLKESDSSPYIFRPFTMNSPNRESKSSPSSDCRLRNKSAKKKSKSDKHDAGRCKEKHSKHGTKHEGYKQVKAEKTKSTLDISCSPSKSKYGKNRKSSSTNRKKDKTCDKQFKSEKLVLSFTDLIGKCDAVEKWEKKIDPSQKLLKLSADLRDSSSKEGWNHSLRPWSTGKHDREKSKCFSPNDQHRLSKTNRALGCRKSFNRKYNKTKPLFYSMTGGRCQRKISPKSKSKTGHLPRKWNENATKRPNSPPVDKRTKDTTTSHSFNYNNNPTPLKEAATPCEPLLSKTCSQHETETTQSTKHTVQTSQIIKSWSHRSVYSSTSSHYIHYSLASSPTYSIAAPVHPPTPAKRRCLREDVSQQQAEENHLRDAKNESAHATSKCQISIPCGDNGSRQPTNQSPSKATKLKKSDQVKKGPGRKGVFNQAPTQKIAKTRSRLEDKNNDSNTKKETGSPEPKKIVSGNRRAESRSKSPRVNTRMEAKDLGTAPGKIKKTKSEKGPVVIKAKTHSPKMESENRQNRQADNLEHGNAVDNKTNTTESQRVVERNTTSRFGGQNLPDKILISLNALRKETIASKNKIRPALAVKKDALLENKEPNQKKNKCDVTSVSLATTREDQTIEKSSEVKGQSKPYPSREESSKNKDSEEARKRSLTSPDKSTKNEVQDTRSVDVARKKPGQKPFIKNKTLKIQYGPALLATSSLESFGYAHHEIYDVERDKSGLSITQRNVKKVGNENKGNTAQKSRKKSPPTKESQSTLPSKVERPLEKTHGNRMRTAMPGGTKDSPNYPNDQSHDDQSPVRTQGHVHSTDQGGGGPQKVDTRHIKRRSLKHVLVPQNSSLAPGPPTISKSDTSQSLSFILKEQPSSTLLDDISCPHFINEETSTFSAEDRTPRTAANACLAQKQTEDVGMDFENLDMIPSKFTHQMSPSNFDKLWKKLKDEINVKRENDIKKSVDTLLRVNQIDSFLYRSHRGDVQHTLDEEAPWLVSQTRSDAIDTCPVVGPNKSPKSLSRIKREKNRPGSSSNEASSRYLPRNKEKIAYTIKYTDLRIPPTRLNATQTLLDNEKTPRMLQKQIAPSRVMMAEDRTSQFPSESIESQTFVVKEGNETLPLGDETLDLGLLDDESQTIEVSDTFPITSTDIKCHHLPKYNDKSIHQNDPDTQCKSKRRVSGNWRDGPRRFSPTEALLNKKVMKNSLSSQGFHKTNRCPQSQVSCEKDNVIEQNESQMHLDCAPGPGKTSSVRENSISTKKWRVPNDPHVRDTKPAAARIYNSAPGRSTKQGTAVSNSASSERCTKQGFSRTSSASPGRKTNKVARRGNTREVSGTPSVSPMSAPHTGPTSTTRITEQGAARVSSATPEGSGKKSATRINQASPVKRPRQSVTKIKRASPERSIKQNATRVSSASPVTSSKQCDTHKTRASPVRSKTESSRRVSSASPARSIKRSTVRNAIPTLEVQTKPSTKRVCSASPLRSTKQVTTKASPERSTKQGSNALQVRSTKQSDMIKTKLSPDRSIRHTTRRVSSASPMRSTKRATTHNATPTPVRNAQQDITRINSVSSAKSTKWSGNRQSSASTVRSRKQDAIRASSASSGVNKKQITSRNNSTSPVRNKKLGAFRDKAKTPEKKSRKISSRERMLSRRNRLVLSSKSTSEKRPVSRDTFVIEIYSDNNDPQAAIRPLSKKTKLGEREALEPNGQTSTKDFVLAEQQRNIKNTKRADRVSSPISTTTSRRSKKPSGLMESMCDTKVDDSPHVNVPFRTKDLQEFSNSQVNIKAIHQKRLPHFTEFSDSGGISQSTSDVRSLDRVDACAPKQYQIDDVIANKNGREDRHGLNKIPVTFNYEDGDDSWQNDGESIRQTETRTVTLDPCEFDTTQETTNLSTVLQREATLLDTVNDSITLTRAPTQTETLENGRTFTLETGQYETTDLVVTEMTTNQIENSTLTPSFEAVHHREAISENFTSSNAAQQYLSPAADNLHRFPLRQFTHKCPGHTPENDVERISTLLTWLELKDSQRNHDGVPADVIGPKDKDVHSISPGSETSNGMKAIKTSPCDDNRLPSQHEDDAFVHQHGDTVDGDAQKDDAELQDKIQKKERSNSEKNGVTENGTHSVQTTIDASLSDAANKEKHRTKPSRRGLHEDVSKPIVDDGLAQTEAVRSLKETVESEKNAMTMRENAGQYKESPITSRYRANTAIYNYVDTNGLSNGFKYKCKEGYEPGSYNEQPSSQRETRRAPGNNRAHEPQTDVKCGLVKTRGSGGVYSTKGIAGGTGRSSPNQEYDDMGVRDTDTSRTVLKSRGEGKQYKQVIGSVSSKNDFESKEQEPFKLKRAPERVEGVMAVNKRLSVLPNTDIFITRMEESTERWLTSDTTHAPVEVDRIGCGQSEVPRAVDKLSASRFTQKVSDGAVGVNSETQGNPQSMCETGKPLNVRDASCEEPLKERDSGVPDIVENTRNGKNRLESEYVSDIKRDVVNTGGDCRNPNSQQRRKAKLKPCPTQNSINLQNGFEENAEKSKGNDKDLESLLLSAIKSASHSIGRHRIKHFFGKSASKKRKRTRSHEPLISRGKESQPETKEVFRLESQQPWSYYDKQQSPLANESKVVTSHEVSSPPCKKTQLSKSAFDDKRQFFEQQSTKSTHSWNHDSIESTTDDKKHFKKRVSSNALSAYSSQGRSDRMNVMEAEKVFSSAKFESFLKRKEERAPLARCDTIQHLRERHQSTSTEVIVSDNKHETLEEFLKLSEHGDERLEHAVDKQDPRKHVPSFKPFRRSVSQPVIPGKRRTKSGLTLVGDEDNPSQCHSAYSPKCSSVAGSQISEEYRSLSEKMSQLSKLISFDNDTRRTFTTIKSQMGNIKLIPAQAKDFVLKLSKSMESENRKNKFCRHRGTPSKPPSPRAIKHLHKKVGQPEKSERNKNDEASFTSFTDQNFSRSPVTDRSPSSKKGEFKMELTPVSSRLARAKTSQSLPKDMNIHFTFPHTRSPEAQNQFGNSRRKYVTRHSVPPYENTNTKSSISEASSDIDLSWADSTLESTLTWLTDKLDNENCNHKEVSGHEEDEEQQEDTMNCSMSGCALDPDEYDDSTNVQDVDINSNMYTNYFKPVNGLPSFTKSFIGDDLRAFLTQDHNCFDEYMFSDAEYQNNPHFDVRLRETYNLLRASFEHRQVDGNPKHPTLSSVQSDTKVDQNSRTDDDSKSPLLKLSTAQGSHTTTSQWHETRDYTDNVSVGNHSHSHRHENADKQQLKVIEGRKLLMTKSPVKPDDCGTQKACSNLLAWSQRYDEARDQRPSPWIRLAASHRQCHSEADEKEIRRRYHTDSETQSTYNDDESVIQRGEHGPPEEQGASTSRDTREAESYTIRRTIQGREEATAETEEGTSRDSKSCDIHLDWYKPQARPAASTSAHSMRAASTYRRTVGSHPHNNLSDFQRQRPRPTPRSSKRKNPQV